MFVNIDGVGVVEFPDGSSPSYIERITREQIYPAHGIKGPDYGFLQTAGRRLVEGITQTPDLARAAGAVLGINEYSLPESDSPIPQARLREFAEKPRQVAGEIVGGGLGSIIPSLAAMGAGALAGLPFGPPGVLAGAAIGGIGSAAILNTGDVYQGLLQEGVSPERARPIAALVTVPVTALDVASLGMWSRLLPGVKGAVARAVGKSIAEKTGAEVAEDGLEKLGEDYLTKKFGSVLASHNIAVPAGVEAVTESAQQAIQEGAQASAMDRDFLTPDRLENIATAGLMGGVGGGIAGVALHPFNRYTPPAKPPEETLNPQEIVELRGYEARARSADLMARLGAPEDRLLLPPPPATEETPRPPEADVGAQVATPVGNFNSAEVGQALAERVNDNRSKRGLEPLSTFTVEDVAQGGASREDIDRLVGIRTNFNPKKKVSSADVLRLAEKKNIIRTDEGFRDFVRRTVGYPDLSTLSQTQLQALMAALDRLPRFPRLTNLPVTTSATNFNEAQYAQAVDAVKQFKSASRKTLARATGLRNENDVEVLRQEMVKRGDLVPQTNDAGTYYALPDEAQQAAPKKPGLWLPGVDGDLQISSTTTDGKEGHGLYQLSPQTGTKALIANFPTQDLAIAEGVRRADPEALPALASNESTGVANKLIARRAQERIQQEAPIGVAARQAMRIGPRPIRGGVTTVEAPAGTGAQAAARIKEAIKPKEAAPAAPSQLLEKLKRIEATLKTRLEKLGLKNVKLDLVSSIINPVTGEPEPRANAFYWKSVITIAMQNQGGHLRALNHESIHALRKLGAISNEDWTILKRKIDNEKWLDKKFGKFTDSVRVRYASQKLSSDDLHEEAVADMFAASEAGDLYLGGIFATIKRRIQAFFETLRNGFAGLGFKSADDVFAAISSGEHGVGTATESEEPAFSFEQGPHGVYEVDSTGEVVPFDDAAYERALREVTQAMARPETELAATRKALSLGRTPVVLRNITESGSKPFKRAGNQRLMTTGSFIKKAVNVHPDSKHYDVIGEEIIKNLPSLINDPIAVFKSAPTSEDPTSYKILIEPKSVNGRPIVVAVKPNSSAPVQGLKTVGSLRGEGPVNYAASIFSVNSGMIQEWNKHGLLRYFDDTKDTAKNEYEPFKGKNTQTKSGVEDYMRPMYSKADEIKRATHVVNDKRYSEQIYNAKTQFARHVTQNAGWGRPARWSGRATYFVTGEDYNKISNGFEHRTPEFIKNDQGIVTQLHYTSGRGLSVPVHQEPSGGMYGVAYRNDGRFEDSFQVTSSKLTALGRSLGFKNDYDPNRQYGIDFFKFSKADDEKKSSHLIELSSGGILYYDSATRTGARRSSAARATNRSLSSPWAKVAFIGGADLERLRAIVGNGNNLDTDLPDEGDVMVVNGNDIEVHHEPAQGDRVLYQESRNAVDLWSRVMSITQRVQHGLQFSKGDASMTYAHAKAHAKFSLGDTPWYYSALAKAVSDLKMNSAPVQQWKNTLIRNETKTIKDEYGPPIVLAGKKFSNLPGVSYDEIDYSGLENWLDLQQGQVKKDDLLKYLSENGIRIIEYVLGEPAAPAFVHTALPEDYVAEPEDTEIPSDERYRTLSDEFDRLNNSGKVNIWAKAKREELGDEKKYKRCIAPIQKKQDAFLRAVQDVTGRKSGHKLREATPDVLPLIEWIRSTVPDGQSFFPPEMWENINEKKYKREWSVFKQEPDTDSWEEKFAEKWTTQKYRDLIQKFDRGTRTIDVLAEEFSATPDEINYALDSYGRVTLTLMSGDRRAIRTRLAAAFTVPGAMKKVLFNSGFSTEAEARANALSMLNEAEQEKAVRSAKGVHHFMSGRVFDTSAQAKQTYRELLLNLPQFEKETTTPVTAELVTAEDFKVRVERGKYPTPVYLITNKLGEDIRGETTFSNAQNYIKKLVEQQRIRPTKEKNYIAPSVHFGGEEAKNLVVHVRFYEKKTPEGKRVLFMEEIQGDWGQAYTKYNYRKSKLENPQKVAIDEWAFTYKAPNGTEHRLNGIGYAEEQARENAIEYAQKVDPLNMYPNRPPLGPIISKADAWVGLAMKRVIRWAADRGYDAVTLPEGEQQAKRWSRSGEEKEGMIYFYNTVVQKTVNDILKKFGGEKVKPIEVAGLSQLLPETPAPVRELNLAEYPEWSAGYEAYPGQIYRDLNVRNLSEYGLGTGYFVQDGYFEKVFGEDGHFHEGGRKGMEKVQKFPDEASAQAMVETLREKMFKSLPKPTNRNEQPGFEVTANLKTTAQTKGFPVSFSLADAMPSAERTVVLRDIAHSISDIREGIDKFVKPMGKLDQLRTILQDRMLPVKRLQEEIAKRGGNLTEAMDSYLHELLFHGRVGDQIGDNEKILYRPLIGELKTRKVELGDFEDWLYARHAPERNDYLKKKFGIENGSGVSTEEAERVKAEMESKYAADDLNVIGGMFDNIIRNTNRIRQAGHLTDVFDPDSGFKYYAPLRSFEEDPDERPDIPAWRRTGLLGDVRGSEDRPMEGRKTLAKNLLAAAIMQNEMAIIRSEKNKVGNAFLNMVRSNKIPGVSIIETNPNPNQWIVDADGSVRVRQSPYYYDQSTLVVKEPQPNDPEKVQETAIRISDQRVADAIKGVNPQSSEVGSFLVRSLGRINRYLSLVNTGLNPEFLISNLIRDLQTAGLVIQGTDYKGTAMQITKNVPAAVRGIWKVIREEPTAANDPWSQTFAEMSEAGGRTYFLGVKDVGDKMREIQKMMSEVKAGDALSVKNALRATEKFVEDVNLVFENATRLSAYKVARDAGASRQKAAALAKNITVNFTRGGQMKTLFNSLYLFYNASLQGTWTILNATRSPLVRKMLGGIVVGGMLMDAMNRALAPDDDDGENAYDKIMRSKPYVGEHFMVLMIPGSKQYFALPMPYGFNAFYNIGRNLASTVAGTTKPADAAKSILFTGVDAFNPLGGTESFLTLVAPTIADPLVELATNRNFAGQKIVPDDSPYSPYKKPNSQLFWSNTAVPYVKVSEWVNKLTGGSTAIPGMVDISPETLEYWIEYAGGATAKFAERSARLGYAGLSGEMEEVEVGQIPFLRKAVGSLDKRANVEAYYDRAKEVLEAKAELKAATAERNPERIRDTIQNYGPKLAMADFFERTDRRLSELRTQKRRVENDPDIESEYKTTLVKRLNEGMDAVIIQANKVYNTYTKAKKE